MASADHVARKARSSPASETRPSLRSWDAGRLPGRERTIADVGAELAPGCPCEDVFAWPPDGFAFSSAVLSESGAYRLTVSPPPGKRWPPADLPRESWEEAVHRWAAEWAAWAVARRPGVRRPEALRALVSKVRASRRLPLAELDEPQGWETLVALLTLHAMADEACTGLGVEPPDEDSFHACARTLLRERGTLSRFVSTRARVLPKTSLPTTGITIRSLSRYLGLDRSETVVRWYHSDARPAAPSRFTLLLVPYPARISPADFRAMRGPLDNMDPELFGFFEFAPRRSLDVGAVLRAVDAGRALVGSVDAVVLPESVLQPGEADALRRSLHELGVPHLVAGVREPAATPHGLGRNYAYVTGTHGGESWAEVQHKHHRWSLDEPQIRQYHLERALRPGRRWWEAIGVERRSLTFVTVDRFLTLCPLICEDLAQPDPVAGIIRGVGPSLVIGLLLDGPQLAERWPARYASVFADDPGCAVLTLTSLGMAERSRPAGFFASRSVALWKDARSGIRELTLDEGAVALVLTASVDHRFAMTADGRSVPTSRLLLEDVRQVVLEGGSARPKRHVAAFVRAGPGRPDNAATPDATAAPRHLAASDVRSDSGVYVCDREARILSWNRPLEKLTGIAADDAVGRHCYEVIGGTDESGQLLCRRDCMVMQRARRGRPSACPPLVLQTTRGPREVEISTLIVRQGVEPVVLHVTRERSLGHRAPPQRG